MVQANKNPKIQFFKVAGHDHFSEIAPLTEILAGQVAKGEIDITPQTVQGLQ